MIFQFSGDNIEVFARSGKLHYKANILKGIFSGYPSFYSGAGFRGVLDTAELDSAVSLTLQNRTPRYYNSDLSDSLLPI